MKAAQTRIRTEVFKSHRRPDGKQSVPKGLPGWGSLAWFEPDVLNQLHYLSLE